MAITTAQLTSASPTEIVDAAELLLTTTDGNNRKMTIDEFRTAAFCEVKCISVTIPTASVLTLNATPVQLVPAAGAGTIIEVLGASGHLTFNSVAYATNVDLEIISSGASVAQFGSSYFINGTVDKYDKFVPTGVAVVSNDNLVANADVNVKVRAGDPTAGDSDITIYCIYRVITL